MSGWSHQRVPDRQLLPSSPRCLFAHSGCAGADDGAGVSSSISVLPRPREPSAPGLPPARASAPQLRRLPAVNLRPRHALRPAALRPAAIRRREAPGASPSPRLGPALDGEGEAAPEVRGAAAATPSGCAVTAPAAEAGGADSWPPEN